MTKKFGVFMSQRTSLGFYETQEKLRGIYVTVYIVWSFLWY